jgi:hypothetical protein
MRKAGNDQVSPTRRRARTGLGLGLLVGAAALMAFYNAYSTQRDIRTATAAPSQAQAAFFVRTAERPDAVEFYKALDKQQKLTMARNLGEHDEPEIPKLIGLLLTDFDSEVRDTLAGSLARLAERRPREVTAELKHAGSFQRVGVFRALDALGSNSIPLVAERLYDGEQRANAGTYLVQVGEPAIPHLLEVLRDQDKDARLAAADALAKLRAQQAVSDLLRLHQDAPPDERLAYLSALAAIGAPEAEDRLKTGFRELTLDTPSRQQSAVGLGRIGSPAGIELLWAQIDHHDHAFRSSVVNGLQLAGEEALRLRPPGVHPGRVIEVASGVQGPAADASLRQHFDHAQREVRVAALRAAAGRPALAGAITATIRRLDPAIDGDVADAAIGALLSTEAGGAELATLEQDQRLKGLIMRRTTLDSPN